MATTKEDRRILSKLKSLEFQLTVEKKNNVHAYGKIEKLQQELEVVKRRSDENNVASFIEIDTVRGELKKKETKELDLQKKLKETEVAKTELEARLKEKIEREVRLLEENETLKRTINEEKEPIDEMRKKFVRDMKSNVDKFADSYLQTHDEIKSMEGPSGSGSNQHQPTLNGIWSELHNVLESLNLNGASPEACSPQQMDGGGGNGYSASAARPFETTEPRNMGPSFGLNGPAEPTVPQPTGRSPPQISFPPGLPRITIPQQGGIASSKPIVTQEYSLGASKVSISQIPQTNKVSISQTPLTNKSKNHLKEEHNLTPEDLNDDQVKI